MKRARSKKVIRSTREHRDTGFTRLLEDLIARVPGAKSAAIVDEAGECVDYAGAGTPFDLQIAAAHWQIVIADICCRLHETNTILIVRASRKSYVTRALPDGYAVVVNLSRYAGFAHTPRAFDVFEREVREEARWSARETAWYAIDVRIDRRGRPVSIMMGDEPIAVANILGHLPSNLAGPREKGFRVRLETGAEFTLVRELGGYWYCDALIAPVRSEARASRKSRKPSAKNPFQKNR